VQPSLQQASRTGPSQAPGVAELTVFGLDVALCGSVPLLRARPAMPTGRTLRLRVERTGSDGLDWPSDADTICEELLPDGTPNFAIESHPQAGYRIHGPRYGVHALSADGRAARCYPEGEEWQRLLIAQVLPFAAVLQGLEVLHAGAVARDRQFLADDVLAVEPVGERLLGHPGTPLAGVARAEAERLEHERRWSEGEQQRVLCAGSRELMVDMQGALEPAELAGAFFLDRRSDGPDRPRFEAVCDPKLLLSATFNFVLAGGERLGRLLDVCALMARLRVERVICGPGADPRAVATAIERELSLGP
jgi:hypothetical protein